MTYDQKGIVQFTLNQYKAALRTARPLRLASRVSVLLAAAEQSAKAGKRGETGEWLKRATRLIEGTDNKRRSEGYTKLAAWEWRRGNRAAANKALRAALASAKAENKAPCRVLLLSEIALAQWQMGDKARGSKAMAEALREASQWEGVKAIQKEFVLWRLVRGMLELGDPKGAVKAAKLIDAGSDKKSPVFSKRQEAFRDIALAQLRLGNVKGAMISLEDVHDEEYRHAVLIAAARTEAQAGSIPDALVTAKRIEDGSRRAQAFLEIALAQARRGDSKGAKKTAKQTGALRRRYNGRDITFGYNTPRTWGVDYSPRVATFRVRWAGLPSYWARRAGLAAAAMPLFKALRRGRRYEKFADDFQILPGYVVRHIARAQARAGDLRAALKWAEELYSPLGKALGILGAAEGHLARCK